MTPARGQGRPHIHRQRNWGSRPGGGLSPMTCPTVAPRGTGALHDPYPGQALVGLAELRKLLSMDRSTLYEFLQDPTSSFPRPVRVGTARSGKPRLRWKKTAVLYWIDGLSPQAEDAQPSENVRKRP